MESAHTNGAVDGRSRARAIRATRPAASPPLRRFRLSHATAVTLIALLTLGTFLMLARTFEDERRQTAAIFEIEHERYVAEQIAGDAARLALGDASIRATYSGRIATFATGYAQLAPAERDDASQAVFVARSRELAAILPDAEGRTQAAEAVERARRGTWMATLDSALRTRTARREQDGAIAQTVAGLAAIGVLLALVIETFGSFRPMARHARRLAHSADELARSATTDALSGLLNRRSFNERAGIEIHKARRYHRPLALLAVDIDDYDTLVATHGSDAAAEILKALAGTLFDGTRATDLVGRIDGPRFAILLPETAAAGAARLAERLRERTHERTIRLGDTDVACTLSIGVAEAEAEASFFGPTSARADHALYEAQARGRNRVVVAA